MLKDQPIVLDSLPLRQRLALNYAPAAAQPAWLAIMAFDTRLASIVRSSKEPMLAQLRLSWWREQLDRDLADWPEGEPLLATLRCLGGAHAGLRLLLDGWEAMIGSAPLPADAFECLAKGRAAAITTAFGAKIHADRMAHNWALADIAARLSNPAEREVATELAQSQDWQQGRLDRIARPLAVLHALAKRDVQRGGNADRISPAGLLLAMRVGMMGR